MGELSIILERYPIKRINKRHISADFRLGQEANMKFFKKTLNLADEPKILETTGKFTLIQKQHEKLKKEPVQKTLTALYKLIYFEKFKACHSTDEVLNSYIKNTEPEVYLEESRLEYVSDYLFINYLIKDKESVESLARILKEKTKINASADSAALNLVDSENNMEKKTLNPVKPKSQLHNELSAFLKDQIASLQKKRSFIDEDEIFISVFSNIRFGLQLIEQDRFLHTLMKVMEDLELLTKDTMSESEIKSYIKQRLIDVKNAEYWDVTEQATRQCNVLLMGRYIRISSTDFMKAASDCSDDPLPVRSTALNDSGKFRIHINGTSFITDASEKDRILKYYEKINAEIIERLNHKVKILKEYITKVSPKLKEIIDDSMNAIPIMLFLDIDNFSAFEYLISSNSYLARQLLDSDAEQLRIVAENLKNDAEFRNNISKIINSSFSELCKLAEKYINMPVEYHAPIVWLLMRQSSVTYMSELWMKEYGKHFKYINTTNIDDYVDVYCGCTDIPTKNIRSVGMFTYYLMGKNMFPGNINDNFIKSCKFLIEKLISKFNKMI